MAIASTSRLDGVDVWANENRAFDLDPEAMLGQR
jgi:hypothetical protein